MITTTPYPGTQAIDRAAQLLVHVVETAEAPTVGELVRAQRAAEEHDVAPRRRRSSGRGSSSATRCAARSCRAPSCVRYARRETPGRDLVALAAESLDRLARASGETVNLGVATADGIEMLDQRDSRHFIGSTNWVGRLVPNHASVVGKVFLAEGAATRCRRGPLEQLAPRTITDHGRAATRPRADARAGLRDRRRRARARPLGGRRCRCATPEARSSRPSAVSGPTVRLRDGLLDELGMLIRDEASTLSTRIGYDDAKRGAA